MINRTGRPVDGGCKVAGRSPLTPPLSPRFNLASRVNKVEAWGEGGEAG
jgi:hypothetical protein